MDQSQIALLEELAANGCPAPVAQALDGWLLRFNWGETGRRNSVLPNAHGGVMPLDERLAYVEAFYRARKQPPMYQLTSASLPDGLDCVLADRGYERSKPVAVQTADLPRAAATVGTPEGYSTALTESLTESWKDVSRAGEERSNRSMDLRHEPLSLIGPPAAYVVAHQEREPVAVGRAVLERGWLGLFGMATVPRYRRQGAARSVLATLFAWGLRRGGTHTYLQVMENNGPANGFYGQAGFETHHQYHYYTGPGP